MSVRDKRLSLEDVTVSFDGFKALNKLTLWEGNVRKTNANEGIEELKACKESTWPRSVPASSTTPRGPSIAPMAGRSS